MIIRSEQLPDGKLDPAALDVDDCAGIVDFAPQRLSATATLGDAERLLTERGLWGVPLVDRDGDYAGMLTVRSLVAAALPVMVERGPQRGIPPAGTESDELLRRQLLDRPACLLVDLDVPVVRASTKLPQLLAVLCRRSPVVPIVPDTGMRLLGLACLERAARALYRR